MYIVCYTPGYWVRVWEGCLGLKGMGKHGEKEFDTIDMDILVFLKFGGGGGYWGGGFLDRGVWEGEIDSWFS